MLPTVSTQRMIRTLSSRKYESETSEKYVKLVAREAFRFLKKYPMIPFEDLFGYGMIGLTNAIKRFTGEEGARLSYYTISIDGEIRHGIVTETNYVHQNINDMNKESSEIVSIPESGIDVADERDNRMIRLEEYLSDNSLSDLESSILKKELKFIQMSKQDICKKFSITSAKYKEILAKTIIKVKQEMIFA